MIIQASINSCCITFLIAPFIIQLFAGNRIPEAVDILRVLCIFTFTTSIVISMGSCMLVPFGYSRPFNMSVILSTFVICIIYSVIYLFDIKTSVSLALALVFGDMFVLVYRGYYCKAYNLFAR